jgi:FkbM family methyltransferase
MRPSDIKRLRRGVVRFSSYRSLIRMGYIFCEPVQAVRRYVDAGYGEYPWRTRLRTPLGQVEVELPHSHDVRTVNEIFCRGDYGSRHPRVVVDVGANIGIATLYFLTRRRDAVVHAWEPLTTNLDTLRRNVGRFADRVQVHAEALSPQGGRLEFRVEPVGRYSGLSDYYQHELDTERVQVDTAPIAQALTQVIAESGGIDLLKVDTEGSEPALIAAIPDSLWPLIAETRYEIDDHIVTRRQGDKRDPQSSGPPAT